MKNKLINSKILTPFFFLLICFIAYGFFNSKFGFYWDDWPYLWLNHSQGIIGFPEFVSQDRPFSAWIFMLTGFLFRESPLGYHFFIIFVRWLGGIAFCWLLNQIWPSQKRINFFITLLFLIYPGFLQTPISIIYSHHFSVLTLFLFSLGLMVFSVRSSHHKILLTFCSILLSLSMFSIENFVTLELLRPVILWFIINKSDSAKKNAIKLIKLWIPYLIIFIIYIIWRAFIFKFPTYQPTLITNLFSLNFSFLKETIIKIGIDLFSTIIIPWINAIFPFNRFVVGKNSFILWSSIICLTLFLLFMFFKLFHKKQTNLVSENNNNDYRNMAVLGSVAIVLAGIPAWIPNIPIRPFFPWDRLTLSFLPGISILIVVFLNSLFKNKIVFIIILCILISFSAAFHNLNSLSFVRENEYFQYFFWQLKWRIPSIENGTTVLTKNFPLIYFSDNSLTAPLNLAYDEGNQSNQLNYMFYDIGVRLGSGLKYLEPGLPINQRYRSFNFIGSTSQTLLIYYAPPACMHVIDPTLDIFNPTIPKEIINAISLTNLNTIQNEDIQYKDSLNYLFGNEPTHNWCYYYEKAALASQFQQWDQVVKLGEVAFTSGGYPDDPIERFPFIEGYAHTGNLSRALELSRKTIEISPLYKEMLCHLWDRISNVKDTGPFPQNVNKFLFSELQCINSQ